MLLSEAFEKYRQDVILYDNQSSKTEESHYYALKFLIQHTGDIEVADLTMQHVRDWRHWLGIDRQVCTVREYLVRLRMVLKHLKREGYEVLDYRRIGLPAREEKVPPFLTREQVAELLIAVGRPTRGYPKVCRLRNVAIIALLYASGLRASELLGLDTHQIVGRDSFTVIGKGRKPRLCFLDDRAEHLITDYLYCRDDHNPALFISHQTGRRLSKSGLQIIFARANTLVDFGVPLHPHVLRHSFATDLLRNNTNMRHTQVMLGHSSIQTTQMYTHVIDHDLREIYRQKHSV